MSLVMNAFKKKIDKLQDKTQDLEVYLRPRKKDFEALVLMVVGGKKYTVSKTDYCDYTTMSKAINAAFEVLRRAKT